MNIFSQNGALGIISETSISIENTIKQPSKLADVELLVLALFKNILKLF